MRLVWRREPGAWNILPTILGTLPFKTTYPPLYHKPWTSILVISCLVKYFKPMVLASIGRIGA
jgi:hypothetical protein